MAIEKNKHVPPSIRETAFNCPICGTFTTQFWSNAYISSRDKNDPPYPWTQKSYEEWKAQEFPPEFKKEGFDQTAAHIEKIITGKPWSEKLDDHYGRGNRQLWNVHVSKCYNCNEESLWLYDKLLWPEHSKAPEPHQDLPADLLADYEEAGKIYTDSPRGAAALLRLVIQKLCVHLGEPGKNINEDIKSLVAKGLPADIQEALDYVRVIGNNAVHPLQMDLKDDIETVETLFSMINYIVENRISDPRKRGQLYGKLPQSVRDAIALRDGKMP